MVETVHIGSIQVDVGPDHLWAAIKDMHNLLPRMLPDYIRRIEFEKGNGEVGSIRVVIFGPAMPEVVPSVRERIERVDEERRIMTVASLEYDHFKVTSELKEGADEYSTDVRVSLEYEPFKSEPAQKEKVLSRVRLVTHQVFRATEAYLFMHPQAYLPNTVEPVSHPFIAHPSSPLCSPS